LQDRTNEKGNEHEVRQTEQEAIRKQNKSSRPFVDDVGIPERTDEKDQEADVSANNGNHHSLNQDRNKRDAIRRTEYEQNKREETVEG
jgi:hypothetical protein